MVQLPRFKVGDLIQCPLPTGRSVTAKVLDIEEGTTDQSILHVECLSGRSIYEDLTFWVLAKKATLV